jgi:hypothetical protein
MGSISDPGACVSAQRREERAWAEAGASLAEAISAELGENYVVISCE